MDLATASVSVTLEQARALLDDPPAWMSDKQKRSLAAFVLRYETSERGKQVERFAAAHEHIGQTIKTIEGRIEQANREVADLHAAVTHGRIKPDEASRQIAVVFRLIAEQRALLDSLDQNQSRAQAMVDADPAEYQQELRTRFKSIGEALPMLSVGYLDGDGDDPFAGGR